MAQVFNQLCPHASSMVPASLTSADAKGLAVREGVHPRRHPSKRLAHHGRAHPAGLLDHLQASEHVPPRVCGA